METSNAESNGVLIPAREVCRQLGVSRRTLYDWEHTDKLVPTRTPGGHLRYRQADIDRLKGVEQ